MLLLVSRVLLGAAQSVCVCVCRRERETVWDREFNKKQAENDLFYICCWNYCSSTTLQPPYTTQVGWRSLGTHLRSGSVLPLALFLLLLLLLLFGWLLWLCMWRELWLASCCAMFFDGLLLLVVYVLLAFVFCFEEFRSDWKQHFFLYWKKKKRKKS